MGSGVLDVSRETHARLEAYAKLVEKWNPRINLVSKSSIADLWDRHFLDSAQILKVCPSFQHWADLGSGGGFPALVLACLTADAPHSPKYTLVESDQRKAVFLRTVIRELGLNARVLSERVEKLAPLDADVVSARALASLIELLGYAQMHLAEGGVAIFPKGARHAEELNEALEKWTFQVQTHQSVTDPHAVIFQIKDIARV